MIWRYFVLLSALLTWGCAGAGMSRAPAPPLMRDHDRRPFRGTLEPYYSPMEWDYLDQSYFRPVVELLAVRPGGESVNVNALDEVPNSSWFENRAERSSASEAARGPCPEPELHDGGVWQIVSAKPDGVYAGFVVKDAAGQRYLLKLDGGLQGPHNSAADVVASRLYYAAGFDVPCNRITHVTRSTLTLSRRAKVQRTNGDEAPLTWAHVDAILARAKPLADGRWRAVASLYLQGRPLGPWQYHGTRADDRNDVVPHEDRRELRGSRLLAAWTGHWDAREQNTLAMWIETGKGLGFVRHHLLDFGDCFGTFAGPSALLIRRRGYVHSFDPVQALTDFSTFGLIERPWDRAPLGPSGVVFGYYDVERFDPETWSPTYPNPAFGRMTEHDAAWMARIIARFDTARLEAIIDAAGLEPSLGRELLRLLQGRRRKILNRYLSRLSPLADPVVKSGREPELCAHDLGVEVGIAARTAYAAWAWNGTGAARAAAVSSPQAGTVCISLAAERSSSLVIELAMPAPASAPHPIRFHLYRGPGEAYRIARIERLAEPGRMGK